jgi:DNA-binding transcriptional ArsR family regulator
MIVFNHLVERKSLLPTSGPMLDQVYGAIADPTRRAILGLLAEGELNVGSLADRFPISLNGVSKHVKVLERAGLVERTVLGREHRLRLNPEPLREASMWLDHYRAFWESRLTALEDYLLKQERRAGPETAQHPREDGR